MKKILFSVAVIATVAIAGWNYQQNKEIELSDLAMENVEALAQGEIENYYNFKLIAVRRKFFKTVVIN